MIKSYGAGSNIINVKNASVQKWSISMPNIIGHTPWNTIVTVKYTT